MRTRQLHVNRMQHAFLENRRLVGMGELHHVRTRHAANEAMTEPVAANTAPVLGALTGNPHDIVAGFLWQYRATLQPPRNSPRASIVGGSGESVIVVELAQQAAQEFRGGGERLARI